jgi:predicted HAD superfamily Cof-like phosphohydrolase
MEAGILLRLWSQKLKRSYIMDRDERANRAQLMLEELSEALLALHLRRELDLLDALADLEYVVVGTATCFDLPLEEAFDEVQRSNMTKGEVRHADGVKGKGPGYSPPDLAKILARRRP